MLNFIVKMPAPWLPHRSRRSHWKTQAMVALLLAGAACASHAQFSSMGGGGRRGGRTADAAQSGTPSARPTTRWEEVSNRLLDVRLQLLITTAQGPAWQDFRARFIDAAMAPSSGAAMVEEQPAAEAFQRQLDAAQQRANALAALNTSARALLASCGDDQRRIADRTLPGLLDEFVGRGGGGAAAGRAGH